MVNLSLRPRPAKAKFKGLPANLEVSPEDTVASVVAKLSAATKLSKTRIRLTVADEGEAGGAPGAKKKHIVLKPEHAVGDYLFSDSPVVFVKDLGPQIPWRTVFILEYLGPLLAHPIIFFGQKFFYRQAFEYTFAQKLVFTLCMLHFLKREIETIYIHKFSSATMPLFNLFKNSGYYWFIAGFNLAFFVYAPASFSSPQAPLWKRFLFSTGFFERSPLFLNLMAALWLWGETSNFWTHFNLASLRNDGSKDHKIPFGYGFNLVSCPNYFFEVVSWIAIAFMCGNWSAYVFTAIGFGQMYVWAVQKHRRYKREFGDRYPRNRKVMVPFLL